MQHSMIRMEMLREGRSIRLPVLLIFYNSILAFITILFLFFNNESQQVGFYAGKSSYLIQFLIISTFQIMAVFVIMPFSVSCMEDVDRSAAEQFSMIPGVIKYHIIAKIHMIVVFNIVLFFSSLPIISLSCIYSGISLLKLVRLLGTVILFSFWSGSLALFFYSLNRRPIFSFAGTVFSYFIFTIGLVLILEIIRNVNLSMTQAGDISTSIAVLCVIVNLFNPLSVFVGYFENLSGNIPMITSYFGNYGIDVTNTTFSYLYFKLAVLVMIVMGVFFLYLSIHYFSTKREV